MASGRRIRLPHFLIPEPERAELVNLKISAIAELVGGEVHGNGTLEIVSVASLKNAGPTDLAYAEEKFYSDVMQSRAGCVMVRSGVFADKTVIVVANPKLAFARAAQLLLQAENQPRTIHPAAVVAEGAVIGNKVKIGRGTGIEEGAVIGNNTTVDAGCFVGRDSRIGEHCTLYAQVAIYRDVEIGNHVIVHSGAVIGAHCFAFSGA